MKKTIKIIGICVLILALLAGSGYFIYDNFFQTNNSTSAEEIIDRADKDLEIINIKINDIEISVENLKKNEAEQNSTINDIKESLSLLEEDSKEWQELNLRLQDLEIKLNSCRREISSMQSEINTLKTYRELISTLQDEVRLLQEVQGTIQNSISSFEERLAHVENLLLQHDNTGMVPSNDAIGGDDVPVEKQVYFVAPCDGVIYIRIEVKPINEYGIVGFHLQSPDGVDLAYNTQRIYNISVYNAVFAMSAGQKIYCYDFSVEKYSFGGYSFVKSKANT